MGTQARADRYTYLPLVGVFAAAAWLAADLAGRPRARLAAGALGAAALVALAALSVRQIGTWRDSATLFGRAVAVTRENWFAEYGLGVALRQRGELASAAEHFGRLFGRAPVLAGEEGPLALLGDAGECRRLLGPPEVSTDRLVSWVAAWVQAGGRSLGKPTGFEKSDGRF